MFLSYRTKYLQFALAAFGTLVGATSFAYAQVGQPPVITNPNFQRQCSWIDGFYVCSDFAWDYCEQFPRPEDCFILHLIPEAPSPGHAVNVVRELLASGNYRYCVVEPQSNNVITCWIDDRELDGIPTTSMEALCEYYRPRGLLCPFDLVLFPTEEYPNDELHPINGGTRGPGLSASKECRAALDGGDGFIGTEDCARLAGLDGTWNLPEECQGVDAPRARFLLTMICQRSDSNS